MMSKKSPQLRFEGFTDDWEDRKLKDVTERVRSNDGRMDLPTLTMSASSGWLDQKDRFSGDSDGASESEWGRVYRLPDVDGGYGNKSRRIIGRSENRRCGYLSRKSRASQYQSFLLKFRP